MIRSRQSIINEQGQHITRLELKSVVAGQGDELIRTLKQMGRFALV